MRSSLESEFPLPSEDVIPAWFKLELSHVFDQLFSKEEAQLNVGGLTHTHRLLQNSGFESRDSGFRGRGFGGSAHAQRLLQHLEFGC
jgi:hypothetical protein